jgi:asparagine synthase (glutamine-hydrolysing)
MSGIVGIVNFDGAPIDRDLLTRLTESMAFRGPDAQQIITTGNAGFGHTMLRTTFEAGNEQQPLSFDGKLWLTADARPDGRDELIAKLGKRFATPPTDAELILHAYEAWKENCVNHLIGDFAFAIWDTEARTLFCARDHFGVKPFYYTRTSNTFIFSNTLNTVRLHPLVSDELHEPAIADYLVFGRNQDLSSTTFHDIHRLPGGHTLSISKDSITIRRYSQITPVSPNNYDKNRVEQFEQLLITATNDRLRTNRVGISMSGGLDSSGIATIARDLLRENSSSSIRACTNVYDTLFPDEERHYSKLAADAIGIPITHLPVDHYALYESDAAEDLEQPEPFLLSPFAGQFTGLLRQLATHSRVALTGYDGDAFMTERPNAYFHYCLRKLKIVELLVSMTWYTRTFRSLPPVGFRSSLKRMFRKENSATTYPSWVDDAFATRVDLRERCHQANSEIPADDHPHSAALRALDSKVWAPLFEGYDPGSTRLPLELRHPLIDIRLVGYLFSLSPIPWCVNKHILRSALNKRLPPAILHRPKAALASDPTLHLVRAGSVRCLDRFDVNPQLTRFVNLSRRRALADEQTTDGRRANLRVFALNHWLTHSLPVDRAVHDLFAQTA